MKSSAIRRSRGFTVFETVIAIGVLAVLLTGFMVVFTPAAEGIRKSINVQQADRMASTLEQELVTLRSEPFTTGFNKAFTWIENKNKDKDALLVYQYRGSMTTLRDDKTPTPVPSVTGLLHIEGRAAYSVTKAGVVALTEALGIEWAKRGVRVVAIAPGVVLTPMVQEVFDQGQALQATYERRTPMHRLGSVDEIAEAALFLTSDEAAYITAETLRVDGGRHVQ